MAESKSGFTPQTPDFLNRVQSSFAQQSVMNLIGAELVKVLPGEVEISIPFRDNLTQQHGFLHAGIITTIADSACGYAAFSLMPAGASVLTVEFKVNLLAPAKGERFVAKGLVVKPGRTITVCSGEVFTLRFKNAQIGCHNDSNDDDASRSSRSRRGLRTLKFYVIIRR
ncbi:PaaI family thioesterase [Desulfosporosinus sp. BG]|uniref:PaaI family thioesterase n=1 Tax=Desulfosporosinus sp. BG TaxID=1633135 RepID=UPI000856460C|nr:PaaI family thioesterase [Desulfosporosinus sp. BG]ODA40646.1 Phenylacetic acid degradation protein PaaD, thioesterase [Desulfosporosinus sp. BG]